MSQKAAQRGLAAIGQALSGVDEELERHAVGRGRLSSAEQLAWIRRQLEQMAQQLSAPELPPKEQRLRGAGQVVADSWPYGNPLGAPVLEAEQLYLRA